MNIFWLNFCFQLTICKMNKSITIFHAYILIDIIINYRCLVTQILISLCYAMCNVYVDKEEKFLLKKT